MENGSRHEHLRHVIEHAAHLLPAQGPITVFVHHNTLHAFEELPFSKAVLKGAETFGCQPFLSEERYHRAFERGRILREDLVAVLLEDLGERGDELLGFLGTRFELRMALLDQTLKFAPEAELRWIVSETEALRRFCPEVSPTLRQHVIAETRRWVLRDLLNGHQPRAASLDRRIQIGVGELTEEFGKKKIEGWSDAVWESFCLRLLWRVCHLGVHGLRRFDAPTAPRVRHRDLLFEATGKDSDELVHDLLLRFCAAFLDQGFANWVLPEREHGIYRSFLALYRHRGGSPQRWCRGLQRELSRLVREKIGPLESIAESLTLLGVVKSEEASYISETLLALRGWAGIIWQVETRGDRVAHPAPPGSLNEFLAVRLILERLALAYVAKESLGFTGPLHELRKTARNYHPKHDSVSVEQRTYQVFQLAQLRGWKPEDLYRLTKPQWSMLVEELETFSSLERRRIYHLAFERRYRIQTLDAITAHTERFGLPVHGEEESGERATASAPRQPQADTPIFQLITCLDDREESFRRHLEEIEPRCETLGAAGFFSVAMYYRGAAEAHAVPLCPIVIKPQHYVQEEIPYTLQELHRRRAWIRQLLGQRSHEIHRGSRTFLAGAVTALFGSLASIPLIARVLFPRLTARIRRSFGRIVEPPMASRLTLERTDSAPGPSMGHLGFTLEEMANIVERLLRDIGLTSCFSRLIIVTGHGSSSLNNPHASAYNCGACSGSRGGPNARAVSRMANEPRVRELLVHRGLAIPSDTVFVGSYHNTCDESVIFYDLEQLPLSHMEDFNRLQQVINQARQRNAHERCRRFYSAKLTLSPEAALAHVEARAEDLSQTRPEYNHASNAVCVVGRRSRTRGLYLDRRSFLVSYDPAQDDEEQKILTRILQAAVPVCAGINLEYYFSTVDVVGFGCGTKLPHNVTSLLGVMDGAASDLRTGLSAQMIEIHEPVRLLFVIETTPEAMLKIMERNPVIGQLCGNGWVQLATLDPDSSAIHLLKEGKFERYHPDQTTLPEMKESSDWYRGWRDHLGFALISNEKTQEFEERVSS